MSAEIDIKRVSPLDAVEPTSVDLVQIKPLATKLHWQASKYNLRTTAENGSYVLWNSYTAPSALSSPNNEKACNCC